MGEKLTGFAGLEEAVRETRTRLFMERAGHSPVSLTPAERLTLGVAFIQAAADAKNTGIEPSQFTVLNKSGVDLTIQALKQIGMDPQYSEEEKLRLTRVTFGRIDWEAAEDTPEFARLRVESILALASGLRSRIEERKDELRQGVVDGYYLLSAQLILRTRRNKRKLLPVNQVRFILNAGMLDEDIRRNVALTWARKMIPEIDDGQFAQIVDYFGKKRQDRQAALELGISKLQTLEQQTTP